MSYKIPFERMVNGVGACIEVNYNHRYTIEITKVDPEIWSEMILESNETEKKIFGTGRTIRPTMTSSTNTLAGRVP